MNFSPKQEIQTTLARISFFLLLEDFMALVEFFIESRETGKWGREREGEDTQQRVTGWEPNLRPLQDDNISWPLNLVLTLTLNLRHHFKVISKPEVYTSCKGPKCSGGDGFRPVLPPGGHHFVQLSGFPLCDRNRNA